MLPTNRERSAVVNAESERMSTPGHVMHVLRYEDKKPQNGVTQQRVSQGLKGHFRPVTRLKPKALLLAYICHVS